MRVIYLHGFASSPASRKASFFSEKLSGLAGFTVEALDLAPNFEHHTITSQLGVMENAIGHQPVVLIGSSLGGYLAALYATYHPEVERLVLLAPAFDFYQLWMGAYSTAKLELWRETGRTSIFHYGAGREVALGYQFLEDAKHYPGFPDFSQPCLVLHGLEDDVVPYQKSARFAAGHSNVELVALNSGHELTDVLPEIWMRASVFINSV